MPKLLECKLDLKFYIKDFSPFDCEEGSFFGSYYISYCLNIRFFIQMWVVFWIEEMMCRIIPLASRAAVPHGVFVLTVDLFYNPFSEFLNNYS